MLRTGPRFGGILYLVQLRALVASSDGCTSEDQPGLQVLHLKGLDFHQNDVAADLPQYQCSTTAAKVGALGGEDTSASHAVQDYTSRLTCYRKGGEGQP